MDLGDVGERKRNSLGCFYFGGLTSIFISEDQERDFLTDETNLGNFIKQMVIYTDTDFKRKG